MHFFPYGGAARLTDRWHVWQTRALARELGVPERDLSISAPTRMQSRSD